MPKKPPNRKAFPGFDLAVGPHAPSKLQHRHPVGPAIPKVPETIPPLDSHVPDAELTRVSSDQVRRRPTQSTTGETDARTTTNFRNLTIDTQVDDVLVTTRTKG